MTTHKVKCKEFPISMSERRLLSEKLSEMQIGTWNVRILNEIGEVIKI